MKIEPGDLCLITGTSNTGTFVTAVEPGPPHWQDRSKTWIVANPSKPLKVSRFDKATGKWVHSIADGTRRIVYREKNLHPIIGPEIPAPNTVFSHADRTLEKV